MRQNHRIMVQLREERKKLSCSKGSTILGVISFMLFLTVVVLYTLYSTSDSFKIYKRLNNINQRDLIDSQIKLILSDYRECRLSLKNQPVTVGQTLTLFKPDISNPSAQFLSKGIIKNGVEVVDITWTSLTPISTNKYKAVIEVALDLRKYNYPLTLIMNAGVIQECYGENSGVDLCEQSGGEFNFTTSKCILKQLNAGTCQAGQVLQGFNTSGEPTCANP